ncbi:hypothetical protein ACFO4O_03810 [Glaciecola siphonariae]|uniref:Uncharacterized protein n=1 Tax=Glaciecola siphonariae TaxID=521012 RepID=A0ABV9LTK2_9ALTE
MTLSTQTIGFLASSTQKTVAIKASASLPVQSELFANVSPITEAKSKKKRWLCNVSEGLRLSKNVENGLNIDSSGKYSQYELMVKLLKAETCDVIYFNCSLSASQIGILKMLQVFSNTELVHSRLAMQFDRAIG